MEMTSEEAFASLREIYLNEDPTKEWPIQVQEFCRFTPSVLYYLYSVVDDPETNSHISWKPDGNSFVIVDAQKCACYSFPFDFLEEWGFTKTVSGSQVEYAHDDFVAGKRELLDNLGPKYKAATYAYLVSQRRKRRSIFAPEIDAKGLSNELSRINIGPKRNAATIAYRDYIWRKLFPLENGAKGLANKLSKINMNDET